jgi:glycosyltransferase involved in cell wall biosynthesis
LKIGILGTRGIPANYGGFETFAEECGAELAARGHTVVVYGRSHYISRALRQYRGISLVVLPTLRWKYTDTLAHTFLSVLHALFQRFDVILICNAANSMYAWLPRLFGVPVAVNVDGIERKRRKWNWLGKSFYWMSEHFSVWFPNAIVTDARVIEEYYREKYGAPSVFIPYGAVTEKPQGLAALDVLELMPRKYFLYVSRLEPENNAHLVVQAFERVRSDKQLVIVGDAPYAAGYIRSLKQTRDTRIQFPGSIYGESYRELMAHAFCYIHATEVGGTHPALIEAMGMGNLIVSNGTPENGEVLGNTGILYKKNDIDDLTRILQHIEDEPGSYEPLRRMARERILENYTWPRVVTRYEQLFADLVRKRPTLTSRRRNADAGGRRSEF